MVRDGVMDGRREKQTLAQPSLHSSWVHLGFRFCNCKWRDCLGGGGRHRRRCCGLGPPGRMHVLRRRISQGSRGQLGLPRWHSGKESARQCRRHKRPGFDSWVGKIPWRRKWQPAPVVLPGKFHGPKEPGGLQSWGRRRAGQDRGN